VRKLHYYSLAFALMASGSVASAAEFSMNFQPVPGATPDSYFGAKVNCNNGVSVMCRTEWPEYMRDEPTPFILESVNVDGEDYIHMVVGDPATGFAQDSYIRGRSGEKDYSYYQDGVLIPNMVSEMAAPYMLAWNKPGTIPGNGPLSGEGNGMGNPGYVAIRQVLGGEWNEVTSTWSCGVVEFCSDFEKSNSALKPRIVQTIYDAGVTSDFEMDMSGTGYDGTMADQVDAVIVNTLKFDSPDIPGNFDMATDTQTGHSVVTGGRYIYEGGGTSYERTTKVWDLNIGAYVFVTDKLYSYQKGTYTYEEGGFDVENVDWTSYYGIDNPDYGL